jgi:hypothetical protein
MDECRVTLDRVGRMRKRPSRVCNKLCSPGVRRFQLVPCVPARQTPKVLVCVSVLVCPSALCLLRPRQAWQAPLLIPFGNIGISEYCDTASGKNAKKESATFSTRRTSGLGPKTRTSAIAHDFFLFFPRRNPQDWQPVRKNLAGVTSQTSQTSPAESCALPGGRV